MSEDDAAANSGIKGFFGGLFSKQGKIL